MTPEQMEWLQARAEALGGNLSAALRQTITDARLLEMARSDYKLLLVEQPDFEIPPHIGIPETRVVEFILSGIGVTETDDLELRRLEERESQ